MVVPNATFFHALPSYTAKHFEPPSPFEQYATSPSSAVTAFSCATVCGFRLAKFSMFTLSVSGSSVRSALTFGVIVSGMGSKPIELNVDRELLPTNYFVWDNFDEVLFERLSRWQKSINEEGYYPKDRDTGRVVA